MHLTQFFVQSEAKHPQS